MPYVSVPNYRSNGYLFNIRGIEQALVIKPKQEFSQVLGRSMRRVGRCEGGRVREASAVERAVYPRAAPLVYPLFGAVVRRVDNRVIKTRLDVRPLYSV